MGRSPKEYVNAIDYPRAHKFSLHWLADALGTSPEAYRELGRSYIGTDRVPIGTCLALARGRSGLARLDEVLGRLAEADPRRAGVARRYFDDMAAAIGEMGRVLRPGHPAVIVVCPSQIAGVAAGALVFRRPTPDRSDCAAVIAARIPECLLVSSPLRSVKTTGVTRRRLPRTS